jgi:hypothetical protein
MATHQAGPSKLRGNGPGEEDSLYSAQGIPEYRVNSRLLRPWEGIKEAPCSCSKCGGNWVVKACPQYWPIDSIALVCFYCGSVIDYVDGLLILEIREVIASQRKHWMSSGRVRDTEITPFAVLKELILMGIDGGLTDMEISQELDIAAEYVSYIRAGGGG